MNLKQSITSSFFFHLVLLLFMVAASNSTKGFPRDPRNVISVDITTEKKDLFYTKTDSEEELPLTPNPSASEEVSLSDQEINVQPAESKETPASEKNVDSVTGQSKIENAEKTSAKTGEFSIMESYYQFIMLHKRIFKQKAGSRVNELLGEALKVNERHFYGGAATVNLKFGPDGNLSEVLVDSSSPDLKAFLEEINWVAMPAPGQLGFTGVQIEFTVLEGSMSFKIDTL